MLVQCKQCGWIHVGCSFDAAEECIREFNSMYMQLTDEQKEDYYHSHHARLSDYQSCHRCDASYKQMIVVDPKDPKISGILRGQPLQTVLFPNA